MTIRRRDWVSIAEAGEDAMKSIERNWPTCEAVTVRIHPAWRCSCGRNLKTWDIILDDTDGTHVPCRIICSGCHTALLTMERYRSVGASDSDE
jgi:hypothetical protein